MPPFSINSPMLGESDEIYREAMDEGHSIQDVLYDQIPVHPLLMAFIDTPQFQRLHFLRMLGPGYFVFNSGNHTRFEHCIGVSHLAGQLLTAIRSRQPELNINNRDILCVMLAGLCHDLGHGPFSHTFEKFIHQIHPESPWKHEEASLHMFTDLLDKNAPKIQPLLDKYQLGELDLRFIRELIMGGDTQMARPAEKRFLYEIIANRRNGIDVDRWDYFLRDTFHLNVKIGFEHVRLLQNCRVIEVDGEWQICYRDKVADAVLAMFSTRFDLHKRIYQHKTNRLIEQMMVDCLESADPHLRFDMADGTSCRLSESIHHMDVYMMLCDDGVLTAIRMSTKPELKSAQSILDRIFKRDLYKQVVRTAPSQELKFNQNDLKVYLSRHAVDDVGRHVNLNDIILVEKKYDFGMGRSNPFERVNFYSKDKPDRATSIPIKEIAPVFPIAWHEHCLYVYYRHNDPEIIQALSYAFIHWANKQKLTVKTRNNSLNPAERVLLNDGLPDTIAPEPSYTALKDELWKHYETPVVREVVLEDGEDILAALDKAEEEKVKRKKQALNGRVEARNEAKKVERAGRMTPPPAVLTGTPPSTKGGAGVAK